MREMSEMRENESLFRKPPKTSIIQKFQTVPLSPVFGISSHIAYTNYQTNKSKKLLHRDNSRINKKVRQKK